jgi:3-methyladenine DNA glycosylase Tag
VTKFAAIEARAARRKGGREALEKLVAAKPRSRAALAATPDAFFLSAIAKQIFRAGFVWKIVDHMWPGTEEAFAGFEPEIVAGYGDLEIAELASDPRVIRHRAKIESVCENARWMMRLAGAHGSFAKFLADWPQDDIVGLWQALRDDGSRLGGMTGPFFLRMVGKDTFLLTDHVMKALRREKLLKGRGASKKDLRAVQDAFNVWRVETRRPLCQLSRILAYSVD